MLRQGGSLRRQGAHRSSSSNSSRPGALSSSLRHRHAVPVPQQQPAAGRWRQPSAAAAPAADAAPAAADRKARPRKPGPRKKAPDEDRIEQGMPDLPSPMDYQQTLARSFTLGGIGLHSGEYAYVRVRPAYAGEGRYFVRVPEGTNSSRFVFSDGSMADMPFEAGIAARSAEGRSSDALEDEKVAWFTGFLAAQEEAGFIGTFSEWTQQEVDAGRLDRRMRLAILGLPDLDDSLPDVEPEFSDVLEEIEPLDASDPSVTAASIFSVTETDRPFTQLGAGEHRVERVELLLAALEACGVDNARIEVEGGNEIPVLDNSALGWCLDIQVAGLRIAPVRPADVAAGDEPLVVPEDEEVVVQRDLLVPTQPVGVSDGDGWISFFPSPFTKLTAGVDHTRMAPVIGSQWFTWQADDVHFRHSLAPARAYVESVDELFEMRAAGYVKAGAENLFLIAAGERWWDPSVVRMVHDEPARHKLATLLGNLALLSVAGSQGVPVGHITAYNADSALQLAFVQALVQAMEQDDFRNASDVLDAQEVWLQRKYSRRSGRRGTSVGAGGAGGARGAAADAGGDEGGAA